jgi:hypothetical protein
VSRLSRLALLCTLLLSSLAARADDLQEVLKVLAAHPLLRTDFSQEKTLPALKKPLHSEGRLIFAGQEGVLLLIKKPVQAQLVITPDVLLQKTARTQTRLRLDQSPYGAMAGIFGQLMSGDVKKLQQSFTVQSVENKGPSWILRLTPRDKRLQKLFKSLRISGDDYLREVQISETGDGETLMRLSAHSTAPASLSDDERALFALAH